jgi:ATP adenylyltransferase
MTNTSPGTPEVGAGEPDGLERLWSPDRLAYIQGENRPSHDEPGEDCPFCRAPTATDEDGLIVARGDHVYVVLNLYPYNTGHVMVCPYRHVAPYINLESDELGELAHFTQRAIRSLQSAFEPQGFNVGMNQGTAGGAGIAAHLHQHVVPRWGGDTNFMPVVARTKVIAQSLQDTRAAVAAAWSSLL